MKKLLLVLFVAILGLNAFAQSDKLQSTEPPFIIYVYGNGHYFKDYLRVTNVTIGSSLGSVTWNENRIIIGSEAFPCPGHTLIWVRISAVMIDFWTLQPYKSATIRVNNINYYNTPNPLSVYIPDNAWLPLVLPDED